MVDWNEFAAIATGLLAVFAAIAARYAKRDIELQLRASHNELQAAREATETSQVMAQRQIEVSQRQLEASYRPLLIDVVPTGPISPNDPLRYAKPPRIDVDFPGGHEQTIDPRQIYAGLIGGRTNIAIPLRNVGSGSRSSSPRWSRPLDNASAQSKVPMSSRSSSRPGRPRGSCVPRG
jgi:hypothetical protein